MGDRLDLQAKFEEILESRNVYFQPPASLLMKYPAIRYSFEELRTRSANNSTMYFASPRYECILITREPDTEYLQKILKIPYCKLGRYYSADNLYHYTFTIYQ